MSLKKTVAIAAAAGALAAVSVPAMALENEFHGSYTFSSVLSNFQDGGSGNFTLTTLNDKVKANNYYEQRTRLNYIAKANDDLKLVTHFEINNRFGNRNTVTTAQTSALDVSGSDLDTDGVNLLTKHAYLDFNLGSNVNAKLGLQPYKDNIKGLLLDADVPGVMVTTKAGAYSLGLGFVRYADGLLGNGVTAPGLVRLGENYSDIYVLENKFAVNKDTSVGLSYYLISSNAITSTATTTTTNAGVQHTLIHTVGLSGESKSGPLTISGFGALQYGKIGTGTAKNDIGKAMAANVSAKIAVGNGAAKAGILYASGDDARTPQLTGWYTPTPNSYNGTGLMILARDTANSPTSTDRYLRRNVTDITVANLGYDASLSDKIYVNTNAGFAWMPSHRNGNSYMGTELNIEPGYKVNSNLTLRAQAAYMMVGKAYSNTADTTGSRADADPTNPYTVRLLASFKF